LLFIFNGKISEKTFPALKRGDFKILLVDNEKRLIAFTRTYQKNNCIAVFNASIRPTAMPIIGKDLNLFMNSEKTTLNTLGSHSFAIFVK